MQPPRGTDWRDLGQADFHSDITNIRASLFEITFLPEGSADLLDYGKEGTVDFAGAADGRK